MSAQFSSAVVFSVMTTLVAIFAWIYARDRQPRARYWMIGWIAILIHFLSALLGNLHIIPPSVDDWCYCVLLIAAASFLRSVSDGFATTARQRVFWGLMLLPGIA